MWSKQQLVTFNPTKTQYIVFSKKVSKTQYPKLYLDNKELKKVSKHKQLGVTFNVNMDFKVHLSENCEKSMKRLTALKKLTNKIPRSSKLRIYTSFIRPVLEYGWQFYMNSSNNALSSLEKVQ